MPPSISISAIVHHCTIVVASISNAVDGLLLCFVASTFWQMRNASLMLLEYRQNRAARISPASFCVKWKNRQVSKADTTQNKDTLHVNLPQHLLQ